MADTDDAQYFSVRTLGDDALRGLERLADARNWSHIRHMVREERQRRQ